MAAPPPAPEHSREASSRILETLSSLFDAGHYDRVLALCREFLASDPDNSWLHYFAGLAWLSKERPADARPHVEFLLERTPNDPSTQELAGLYCAAVRQHARALEHYQAAISLDPNRWSYHYHAAIASARMYRVVQAQAYAATAVALAPTNANAQHLAIELGAFQENSARQAWERIRKLEESLALDPTHAGIHRSIGCVYLDQLAMPKEAEHHFRQALLHDPSNREAQKQLFLAIGQRRLVYRVLSIPSRTFAWLARVIRGLMARPLYILALLLGFKLWIAGLIWLALATIVFLPACLIYEWLLISEIRCAAETPDAALRWKLRLHRLPLWLRFLIAVLLICAMWSVGFVALGLSLAAGFTAVGVFVGFHFVVVTLHWSLRRLRARFGRRSAERRRQNASVPPPLPRR